MLSINPHPPGNGERQIRDEMFSVSVVSLLIYICPKDLWALN